MISLLLLLFQTGSGEGAIHITLGSSVVALIAHSVYREIRERRPNGNGKPRCSAEDLIYWERMNQNVTRPIVEAVRELGEKK